MNIDEQTRDRAPRLNDRIKMKFLDDVFHMMIIALERLETFLEFHRKGDDATKFVATGMFSPRDLHDDQKTPPTIESLLGEVQLQCSALSFQTKFDNDKLFKQAMKYFMTDLLEWYGGRDKEIPYDEVERFVLPIAVSLSRQVDSVRDIMQVCDDYVIKLPRIQDFSNEQKEQAVRSGFVAFLEARHRVEEQLQEFASSGEEVVFSAHRRGSAVGGYTRLMDAMLRLYDTTTPAKKIRSTFNAYVEGLPDFTDEMIEEIFSSKRQVREDVKTDSFREDDCCSEHSKIPDECSSLVRVLSTFARMIPKMKKCCLKKFFENEHMPLRDYEAQPKSGEIQESNVAGDLLIEEPKNNHNQDKE